MTIFFAGPQLLSDIGNYFICLENEHLHCKDISTFYSVNLVIIAGPEGTRFTLVLHVLLEWGLLVHLQWRSICDPAE